MVAGKVKQAMGLTPKPDKPKPKPNSKPNSNYKPPPPPPPPTTAPTTATKPTQRTFGSYFPRASAQVQPSVSDLIQLVNDFKEREEYLKRELRETVSLKPTLAKLVSRVAELECENHRLVEEREQTKAAFEADIKERDGKIVAMMAEVDEVNKQLSSSHRFQGLVEVGNKSNLIKSLSSTRKLFTSTTHIDRDVSRISIVKPEDNNNNVVELPTHRIGIPRVPKPPPRKCLSDCSSSSSSSSHFVEPPPPPPPPPLPAAVKKVAVTAPPPPPPPVARIGGKYMTAKVRRVPEVVEFYHSLMRRDTRREAGGGMAEVAATNSAKDLVGEIENRSAYLSAIKTDVETQGDFIRFLIKEVETAAFTDIEDVVSFVKWLDDELSYLVDERAVLKHFDWPEQKADGLREAAFEYSDLKKLESEASSFRPDPRQACSTTLKKMQTLLEKLEHGVYNLSRLKESATNRFKSFHIPVNWMLDTGFISQIKLASVKLAMKYMKRVLAELEIVVGGPEEEELIVQGVRFAFRVHQFAGGFDAETMTAFEELRDKARSFHVQCQNKQPQRLACQTMPY